MKNLAVLNTTVQVTANAAPVDPSVPGVSPVNRAVVYGQPGKALIAHGSLGLLIKGEYSPSYMYECPFSIKENGRASLSLQYELASSPEMEQKDIVLQLEIVDVSGARAGPFQVVTGSYRSSEYRNFAYNNTTGAPADGETYCSVYVVGQTPACEKAYVRVTGSARIVGARTGEDQGWTVPFSSDGTVTVDITDTVAEEVEVVVLLLDSPDSDRATFRIRFNEPREQG